MAKTKEETETKKTPQELLEDSIRDSIFWPAYCAKKAAEEAAKTEAAKK